MLIHKTHTIKNAIKIMDVLFSGTQMIDIASKALIELSEMF